MPFLVPATICSISKPMLDREIVAALVEVLPIACVLTIPAAGSEASMNTVVSNDELQRKAGYGSDAIRPELAFMNPEITFTLPAYQTAAGITDMFAHLLERFFDETPAVPVTDNLNLSLMRTVRAEGAVRAQIETPKTIGTSV